MNLQTKTATPPYGLPKIMPLEISIAVYRNLQNHCLSFIIKTTRVEVTKSRVRILNHMNYIDYKCLEYVPRKQLGTTRYLLDSYLSGSIVPTLSRDVISPRESLKVTVLVWKTVPF